jgi:hypothetical protein
MSSTQREASRRSKKVSTGQSDVPTVTALMLLDVGAAFDVSCFFAF